MRLKFKTFLVLFLIIYFTYCQNVNFQTHLFALQQRMMDLQQQHSELEKENAGLQKNLKDCHILLIAAKVDPGEFVLPFQ